MPNILLGDMVWKITGESTQFNKAVADSEKKANRFGQGVSKIGGVIARGFAVASTAIAAVGIASLKAASDAEETDNKFNVVFSTIKDQAARVATDLQKNYGLSSKASKALLSDTSDLLAGFKFTQKESLSLSKQINTLAVDLASFTNYHGGAIGASKALTAALTGEREQIKALGIVISEADIKRLAEDKGIVGEIDRQTKALLTLELAVSQSANAIGDFQRSQASFANQSKITLSRLDDLQVIIGSQFLPVITDIVSELGDMLLVMQENENLMDGLEVVVGTVSFAFEILFNTFKFGVDIITGLISGLGFFTNSLSGATDETYNLNYAFNQQNDTASKLTNQFKKLKEQQADGKDVSFELYNVTKDLNDLWPESIDLVDGATTSYEDLAKAVEKARVKEQIKLTQDLAAVELERLRAAEKVYDETSGSVERFSGLLRELVTYEEIRNRAAAVSENERKLRVAETRKEYSALSGVLSEMDIAYLSFLNIQESLKIAQDDSLLSLLRNAQAHGANKEQIEESREKLDGYQKALEELAVLLTGTAELTSENTEELEDLTVKTEEQTEKVFDLNQAWNDGLLEQIAGIEQLAQIQAAAEERKRNEILETQRVQKNAFKAIFSGASTLADNIFEARKSGLDKESEEYKKAARTQFEVNKAVAAINAGISGIEATQKIFATVPPPFGIPAAVLMGVITAANVAAILSQKFPGFENSGIVPGTSYRGDNVPIMTNSREMVLSTDDQKNLLAMIKSGGTGEDSSAPFKLVVMLPDMRDITEQTVKQINNREYLIDMRSISEDL